MIQSHRHRLPTQAMALTFLCIPMPLLCLQDGRTFCRRRECDCVDPEADLFCCPECDSRKSSQCLHQSGHILYRSRDSWIYSCQQCRCVVCTHTCAFACIACTYTHLHACVLYCTKTHTLVHTCIFYTCATWMKRMCVSPLILIACLS